MTESLPNPIDLPPVFAGLVRRLADTSGALGDAYSELSRGAKRAIQTGPRLSGHADNDFLMASAAASTTLSMAAADLRTMLNAYSQVIAEERPNLGALAALQRISPSALRHRYSEPHVEAVREMDRPDPLIDLILEPFAGLREHHLAGLSSTLDAQLQLRARMRKAAVDEAWSLNPDAGSTRFDTDQVVMLLPNGEPLTADEPRLIAEAGPFLRRALADRDPELVPVYDDWTSRFEKRQFRLNPVRKARARN